MFEAYKIGVTVAVTNMAGAALAKVARDFTAAGRSVKTLNREIERLKKRSGPEGTLARQAATQRAVQARAQATGKTLAAQQTALVGQAALLQKQMEATPRLDDAEFSRGERRISDKRLKAEQDYFNKKNKLMSEATHLSRRATEAQMAHNNRVLSRKAKDEEFARQQANVDAEKDSLKRAAMQESLDERRNKEERRRVLQDARSETASLRNQERLRTAINARGNLDQAHAIRTQQLDDETDALNERRERRKQRREIESLRLQTEATKLDSKRNELAARAEEARLRGDHAGAKALEHEKDRVESARRLVNAEKEVAREQERQNALLRRNHGLRRGLRHVCGGQWLESRNGGGDG